MKRYHVTTFGCQMNEHNSERMKGMLESLGYTEAASQDHADLILFNTCSIREKADDRFVAHLGHAKRLKREDPNRVIGVGELLGPIYLSRMRCSNGFPFVNIAFGPGQVHSSPSFSPRTRSPPRVSSSLKASPDIFRLSAPASTRGGCRSASAATACVHIASCLLRVDERSVVRRMNSWQRPRDSPPMGCSRSRLLGQNVNSYGRDLPEGHAPLIRRATF